MGRITVSISDDLEEEFRRAVAVSLGFKKFGNLRIAVEDALRNWIRDKQASV